LPFFRRHWLVASLALAACAFTGAAASQPAFPAKPIRIVVPYTAGGTTDMLARLVGKKMTEKWGQPVVIENKPGANGIIGMDVVAKSAPDGYTLGLASPGTHAINQALYPSLPHDPVRDFDPVSLLVEAPMGLVVNAKLPVKSVKELVTLANAEGDKLSFASGGLGSSQHMAYELFRSATGIHAVHVPYKGGGAAYTDLLGGRVQAMFDAVQQSLPNIQSGKLRLLAVASSRRLPFLPDVPTVAEAGVPGFEMAAWYGLVAPAGVPKPILDKLAGEIAEAINSPDVRDHLVSIGLVPAANGPQQFARLIQSETARFAKVVKTANIKPE
jgi:tripartite-type tricarboxylate transporter receptor subunit TctC